MLKTIRSISTTFHRGTRKMSGGNSDLEWKTLFDNMQAKSAAAMSKNKKAAKPKPVDGAAADISNNHAQEAAMEIGDGASPPKTSASNKRLSVERIYQKKTQLEHILLRPDSYIGTVEALTEPMWVLDEEGVRMIQRDVKYVPGLYKIFDEIIVNAADNKQRDAKMDTLKVDIDPEGNKIKVWNNGKGIPVVEHKEQQMYVPTMIFGHLLTSSNYDDTEKKVTGGRNGYGAKLCNIFSTKFIVETSSKEYKKAFKQTWSDNMSKTKAPTIMDAKEKDFTCVTFQPDLPKFNMTSLDADIVALMTRRAYDIAASAPGVKVYLNGKRVPVKNFKDYVDLFLKDKTDETGGKLEVNYEKVSERWEVAVTSSEKGFQQMSFVNSIATTKGGRHVDYVTDQCVSKLVEIVKKKNKGGVTIKPFQVKSHLWMFVNCLIENPTFDSQTKENMTKQAKSFGSKCQLSDKFITAVSKSGVVENILSWMKFKAQAQLNKKCHSSKHSKLKGIPKLDDANDAGTKNSNLCTLILTEGDSAKTLAVAGLGVIGRDRYGVFPLRGKLLNVREAKHKQILENAEINNVIKILGLHFKENYEDPAKLKQLRYGKMMIMTDQDQDGSHIKGLVINFIHHFWPSLLRHNFVDQFITPIVKVTKGKVEKAFYSLPEFEEWKSETSNWHTYKVKYYKGLGTSTSKEAKEYFQDMQRHLISFRYSGGEDDSAINLAFSKKKIEERKEWLTNHMEEKKRREEMGLAELYLYGKQTKSISFSDFVNRELILFSNADLVRSVPSLMDGLKPGQRKVIFSCIKRNLVNKEVKVAQLAGSVAELSAYHHGETSLMGTIINLAQNFIGSNNLNLLQPIGQFGTRIHGGKDAASPRYIFTMLSPLTRLIFHANDDALLNNLYDDNQKIEPEWYCPIIPLALINGAEGIGTGWSTKIPNFDVVEIINNLKRMLDGDDPLPMAPSFKNFQGVIEEVNPGENRFAVHGEISILDETTLEITELPVRTWTQAYKEDVLEVMLHGTEKTPGGIISDYKEYHTDTTVKFVVKMSAEKLIEAEHAGLHKYFRLTNVLSLNTMVLFDHTGCIKRYEKVEDILVEFYGVRMTHYQKRKDYLEGMLSAESLKMDNIARFIMEKIEGKVVIENKPKKELIQILVRRGYDSDPVKAWKETQNKKDKDDLLDTEEEEDGSGPDFNYILGMPLWNLTKEKKDELCKQRDLKAEELSTLRRKSPKDLWKEDLEALSVGLEEVRLQELADAKSGEDLKPVKATTKGGRNVAGKPKKALVDTMPSPMGRRVEPVIAVAIKTKAKDAARKLFNKKEKKELVLEGEEEESGALDFIKQEEGGSAEGVAVTAKPVRGRGSRGGRGAGATRGGAAAGRGRGKVKAEGAGRGSPKKKAKKDSWDSGASSDQDEDLGSLSEDSDMDSKPVIPRESTSKRAAAAKVTYKFDDEEVVESDDDNNRLVPNGVSDNDDDYDGGVQILDGDDHDDGGEGDDDKAVVLNSDLESSPKKPSPPPKPKAAPKPKAPPAAKKTAAAKPAAAKKSAPAKKKAKTAFDSDEDEESQHSKALQDNKALYPSSDDEDERNAPPGDAPPKPKAAPAKAPPKKAAAAPKPKKAAALTLSDEDSSPIKKAPAKKRTKAAMDSGDEDGYVPKKKAAAAKSKKKAAPKGSDFDSDMDDEDDFKPSGDMARATTGRSRQAIKYNFSSDEDDFE